MRFFDAPVDLTGYVETLVIPKAGQDFVFKARPVVQADYDAFELLCERPKAQVFYKPGGGQELDTQDSGYVEALKKYNQYRTDYMFMTSLSATDGLTWDTVEVDKPETWGNVEEELKASGFLNPEVVMLFNMVVTANGLDSDKIKKATDSFLAMVGNLAN